MSTASQIKRIHTLRAKAGIDEDLYRQMLAKPQFNVKSSTELSYIKANEFIAELYKASGLKPYSVRDTGKRPKELASADQKAMIEGMWKDVSRKTINADRKKALNHFLERFGVSHLDWLTRRKVEKVAKALVAMGARRPEVYLKEISELKKQGVQHG